MATSTSASRRKAPGTHPTVWAGLVLSIVGLLLAMYAYTGTRIYDLVFAFVAIGGGALALIGILVAAWGRAVMTARAQRARRGLAAKPGAREVPVDAAEPQEAPPTVAAPAQKRSALRMPALPKLGRRKDAAPTNTAQLFQFRRRSPAKAQDAPAVVEVTADVPPAPAAPDATADGEPVRITMKCPQCGTEFSAEGVQPLTVACPACGLSGTV